MNDELRIDRETLAEEIARYLAAVDAFRAAECEPTWRAELPRVVEDAVAADAPPAGVERSAH